jgi:hypothetical protein
VLQYWKKPPERCSRLPGGTWGPKVADDLIDGINRTWRYPCKNLSNDGIYCDYNLSPMKPEVRIFTHRQLCRFSCEEFLSLANDQFITRK